MLRLSGLSSQGNGVIINQMRCIYRGLVLYIRGSGMVCLLSGASSRGQIGRVRLDWGRVYLVSGSGDVMGRWRGSIAQKIFAVWKILLCKSTEISCF